MAAPEKTKIKLTDTANPFAYIQAAEDAKKKKKPAPPAPGVLDAVGNYGKATAKKLWPSVFNK